MLLKKRAGTFIVLMQCCLFIFIFPAKSAEETNDLIEFLKGEWQNTSFEIADARPIKKLSYSETMVRKDNDTLTITAHKSRDGKGSIKDMHIQIKGHRAILELGPFKASGKRENNCYVFTGKDKSQDVRKDYRLRLYTLGDKYVFIREIWSGGAVEEVDMSYLTRQK